MNTSSFFRCDGEAFCDIEVNSGVFGDPCPNTHKYVEVHYACSSQFGRGAPGIDRTTKKLPPWFLQGSAGSLWTSETVDTEPESNPGTERGLSNRVPQKPSPRKPILGRYLEYRLNIAHRFNFCHVRKSKYCTQCLLTVTTLVNNTKQQRFKNHAISEPCFLLDFFNFLKKYK